MKRDSIVSRGLYRAIRLLESWRNYGNPIQVLWQRSRRPALTHFRIVDRRSGVACQCRPQAHRMFGEVWFDRDYDVPGLVLRPGDLVLDIGGNQGFFSCYAAWHGCRVLTFEPDSESLQLLKGNVEFNGFASQVTVFPMAVKAMAGEAQLFRTERLGGGMNTTTAQFAQNMGFDEDDRIVVPAISLPAVIEREAPARIRLCKIDCEGAELEIIESLGLAEMERIDAFAIEFHREAYSPIRLVEALEHSGTHQVFPAGPKSYCQRNILYALSKELLREIVSPEARLAAATSCCE